jgi:hypothetical protein
VSVLGRVKALETNIKKHGTISKSKAKYANGKERLTDMCNLRTGQKSCRKCPARFYCPESGKKTRKQKRK